MCSSLSNDKMPSALRIYVGIEAFMKSTHSDENFKDAILLSSGLHISEEKSVGQNSEFHRTSRGEEELG